MITNRLTLLTLLLTLLTLVESLFVYKLSAYRDSQMQSGIDAVHSLRYLELRVQKTHVSFLTLDSASNLWASELDNDVSAGPDAISQVLSAEAALNTGLSFLMAHLPAVTGSADVSKLSADVHQYESYFEAAQQTSSVARAQDLLLVQNESVTLLVIKDFDRLEGLLSQKVDMNNQRSMMYTTRTQTQITLVVLISMLLALALVFYILRLRRVEKRGLEAQKMYEFLVENITDFVAIVRSDGAIEYASPSYAAIGYNPISLMGHTARDFVHPNDYPMISSVLKSNFSSTEPQKVQLRFRDAEGNYVPMEACIQAPGDTDHRARAVVVSRDTTRQQALQNIMYHTQVFDTLTGLPNRFKWVGDSQQLLERLPEAGAVVVGIMKVSGVRTIIRAFGRVAGDAVIKEVAERLRTLVTHRGIAARLDEQLFGVTCCLAGDTSSESLITEILRAVESPMFFNDSEFSVSATFGVADLSTNDGDVRALIEEAELALDYSVDNARSFTIFRDEVGLLSVRRMDVSTRLSVALARGEMYLVYQPRVQTDSRRVVGAEALLRWNSPDLGVVSPGEFIPIAESTGHIVQIGEWVIRTAFAQQVAWTNAGFRDVEISVNLSGRQLFESGLVQMMQSALTDTGAQARYINLEITESVMASNPDVRSTIAALRELGFRLSIDDFGTGYSSFAYLQNYPFDVLKIDQSFVQHLGSSEHSTTIVQSMVDLAHSLGAISVGEGVETDGQVNLLKALKCDEIQGYLISPPLPSSDFAARFLEAEGQGSSAWFTQVVDTVAGK